MLQDILTIKSKHTFMFIKTYFYEKKEACYACNAMSKFFGYSQNDCARALFFIYKLLSRVDF